MTTFSRYVLKEHLWPFALGFSLIIFVLLMDVVLQMMDQVLSKGLALFLALQLLLFNLAWIIALAVPMAVLMAVLMAFGRLAADNEIMAAKACGVSFVHLLRPVLVAATALTALMIFFNDHVLPDWNHQARNIASSLKRRKAALALKQKENVFIHDLGDYSLLIRRVDEQRNLLEGITLYDARRPGPPSTLHAPRGHIELFADGSYIRLTLEEGEFYRFEEGDGRRFLRGRFARQVIHVDDPQRAFDERLSAYRSDREMDIGAMYEAVLQRREEQERARTEIDSLVQHFIAAHGEAPPGFDHEAEYQALRQRLERENRQLASRQARIDEFLVEIHKKFSIPVACLVFVLVGAPLGVLMRRRGAAVSVGISLVFFWIYWMFLIGGEELADRGYIAPAVSMWAPNLFFGLIGFLLLRATSLDRRLQRGPRRPPESAAP